MKLTAGDWLTVTPSVGTHLTARRFSSPSFEPRLRLSIRPTGSSRQEISLAVGKYNQVARGLTDERDAGTVFTVWKPSSGDQALLEALHGIMGYQQQIGSSLEASVEGYVKDLRNIPVPKWNTVARFNTRTTLANGLAYGADARIVLDKAPFYFYVGYGWSKVKYEAARRNLGAWAGGEVVEYNPPHDRRHQVNAVVSYELGEFTMNARWEFGSGRPYTKVYGFDLKLELPREHPATSPGTARTLYSRPYGARLPPYHKLDLSAQRSFDLTPRTSLEAKLGAVNTYDRQNIFYYDINTLKRVNQTPLLPYFSVRFQVN